MSGGWILKTVIPSSQLKSSLEFRISGQTILLLNYGSRLELHTSVYNQIEKTVHTTPQVSIPISGPIEHLRFLGENKVLAINSRSQFQVLALSPHGISVLFRGTLEDGVRRPLDRGSLVCVDPFMRFFLYLSTQGVMRLIPLVYRGLDVYLGCVHNCRLQELNVIDLAITKHPKLSDTLILHVLYQESTSQFKLQRYWIDWSAPSVFSPDRHITHQPNSQIIQMSQPQKLVVLPNQLDLLVFAADGVSLLYTAEDKYLSVRTALIKYTAFKAVSDQMVVCGDVEGKLYTLQRFGENIRLQFLGKAEPCVCLEYLGEALVWCGAAPGFTSQIIHFTTEPNTRGEYLKSVEPWGGELGSSLFSDACTLLSETILASCTSRMPFPPKGSLWMIKEGYGCRLTDAVELETGGAPLTKLFHVTMDSTLYFVVGDASGKRVVLDYQKGFQPAQQLETASLELLRGARGLRMSNRGEFYSFSERSVFLTSPRMELVYKAPPTGNPIKNVDVYEDVCVVHSQNDLIFGPVGWAWKHSLPIIGEIAALTLGRCSPEEYILAVVDWNCTLRVYTFDQHRMECRFEMQLTGCVAPRDVCVLAGEFVLVGDTRGQLFSLRQSADAAVEVNQVGNGPIKFEPFLDRIVILGEKPSVLSVVHGIVGLKPLNLPPLSAFVDMGMGAFAAVTCGSNVLINGTIEIDNPFGKQITKVDLEDYCGNVCALEGNPSLVAVATHGQEGEPSQVRLLGGDMKQPLDTFTLLPNETITSMCTTNRLDDAPPGDLIIIGTSFTSTGAWEEYEQMEAEKGRLVVLCVGERKKMKLQGALEVEGGVNAVQVCLGKLVACVNANNCVYKWSVISTAATSTSSPPNSLTSLKGSLQCLSLTPGQIMGVSLSVRGKNVLVGDLLKSLTMYELEAERKLNLVMNDVSSHWILSTHLLSGHKEVALASDTFGNILLYCMVADPFIPNRSILAVSSGYFLGSLITKILPKKEGDELLLIGESGQMWELKACEDEFNFLARLEDILAGRLAPMHHQHRQMYEKTPTTHTPKMKLFIDGDLLIRFMELPFKEKEEIADLLGTTAPAITQLLQK